MQPPRPQSPRRRKLSLRWAKWLLGLVLGCLLVWGIGLGWALRSASTQPIGAIFVLGGSIKREIYAAKLEKQFPNVPILISSGSPQPCVRLIFEREQANLRQVWLEECARSTFGNFYFSLPILEQWRVRKVKLVTSATHTERALTMAKIILGSHGIWVEPDFAIEQGRPGNRESLGKTVLDVGRSLAWAIASQVYQPRCDKVIPLEAVDIATWRKQGFQCERQGNIAI